MSWAIWIMGPPASGKTTLARAVATALEHRGTAVTVLGLDHVRRPTPGRSLSEAEDDAAHRALVITARQLTEAGVPVLIDATARRRAWRRFAREMIPAFAEVELRCPAEVRRLRQLRRRSGSGPAGTEAAPSMDPAAGAPAPYESAITPDLALDTSACDGWTQVQAVVYLVERLARRAATGTAGIGAKVTPIAC
jgi:adenylylsulfate kinase